MKIKRIIFSAVVLVFFSEFFSCVFRRKGESLSFGRTLVKSMYATCIFKSVCGERKTDSVVQYILWRM